MKPKKRNPKSGPSFSDKFLLGKKKAAAERQKRIDRAISKKESGVNLDKPGTMAQVAADPKDQAKMMRQNARQKAKSSRGRGGSRRAQKLFRNVNEMKVKNKSMFIDSEIEKKKK